MEVWFRIRPPPGWWWLEADATWTRPLYAQNRISSYRSSIKSQICTRLRLGPISQRMTRLFPQGRSMVLTFPTSHPSSTLEKEKEWTRSRKEEWRTTKGRLGYWSKSNVCEVSFRINLRRSWRCPKTSAVSNSNRIRHMASCTAKHPTSPCYHSNSCNHQPLLHRTKRIWPSQPLKLERRYSNSRSVKHWNKSWWKGCRVRHSQTKVAIDQRTSSCLTLEEKRLHRGSIA